MGELDGRIAIITGAGRGIGFGIAQRLGRAGAIPVIAEFNAALGQDAVGKLAEAGIPAHFVPVNVAQPASVDAMVVAVQEQHGRIDILVNNAGLAQIAPTETMALDDWTRQVDVMYNGVFLCTQAAGRVMLAQGKGVILNISSIGGLGAWPMRQAYNSAKAAVISLTENIGAEWARRGVRVVSIAPGVTRTAILQQMVDEGIATLEKYNRRAPMGRVGEVEEIASVAQFLVSDRASYITATTVTVDGGWTAWGNLPL
ncbi:MAG: SDR family oxidoreductase [Chloroflexi bacterium]|nr:SDR family oxidoreductase [Chloroflexota bacterium]